MIQIGTLTCEKASVFRRFGAAMIDIVIATLFLFVPIVNVAFIIAYWLCRDSFPILKGKSVGKHLFGIRVMSSMTRHDLQGDYSSSITRNLPLALFGIDLLLILFSTNSIRFGDRWAKTIVVRDSKILRDYNRTVYRNHKRFVNVTDPYELY